MVSSWTTSPNNSQFQPRMPYIANKQPTVYTLGDPLAHSDPCWSQELGLTQDSPMETQQKKTEEVTYEGWHHVNNV